MRTMLIILSAAALTFAIRFSFIGLQGEREFPPALKRALRFVPASVLAAIVWPGVIAPHRELHLEPGNFQIYAALAAAAVAWKTRNILATLRRAWGCCGRCSGLRRSTGAAGGAWE